MCIKHTLKERENWETQKSVEDKTHIVSANARSERVEHKKITFELSIIVDKLKAITMGY